MVERQTDWQVLAFGVIASVIILTLVGMAGYGLNSYQMGDLRNDVESTQFKAQ